MDFTQQGYGVTGSYDVDRWGPFTVDRIANSKNTKNPGTTPGSGIRVVKHSMRSRKIRVMWPTGWSLRCVCCLVFCITHERAELLILIVPHWESCPYWPMLKKRDSTFRQLVTDFEVSHDTRLLLEHGDFKRSLLGSPRFASPIVAFKCRFSTVQPGGIARYSRSDRVRGNRVRGGSTSNIGLTLQSVPSSIFYENNALLHTKSRNSPLTRCLHKNTLLKDDLNQFWLVGFFSLDFNLGLTPLFTMWINDPFFIPIL